MIPRKLHFIWIDPDREHDGELPADVQSHISRWADTHPTFDIQVWSRDRLHRTLGDVLGTDIGRLMSTCRLQAMQADIARLALIYRFGGVWSDLKNWPKGPFLEELIASRSLVLCERPPNAKQQRLAGGISNGFFASEPSGLFVGECLKRVIDNVRARRQGGVYGVTGGGVLQRVAKHTLSNYEPDQILLMTWQEAWQTHIARRALGYSRTHLHWSKHQKLESLYLD